MPLALAGHEPNRRCVSERDLTIQAIQRKRRSKSFVGRTTEIQSFRRNLALPNDEKRFVWNIYGQGGIGKTSLVKQCLSIAAEESGVGALVDEAQSNTLDAMASIAEQLKGQGVVLEHFAERYHKYRELRQQVEADAKKPSGASSLIGRAVGKAGVSLVRQIPGAGIALDFMGEENVIAQAGEFASYLAERFSNKDDVQLIVEPIEVLTPLFLQDLSKRSTGKVVVVALDTFERTGSFLDNWVRDILEGRYGDLGTGVIIIIAGRDRLGPAWAEYNDLIQRVALGVLTESEAVSLLNARKISDKQTVELILELSGRIPLWVATLGAQVPEGGELPADPTGEAIDRFLKWVQNDRKRKAAVLCALPDRLDRDVINVLLGGDDTEPLFEWLKTQPFVQKKVARGWVYHEVVRTMMRRHLRDESRTDWDDAHSKLASFFSTRRDLHRPNTTDPRDSDTWVGLDLSAVFHSLCADANSGLQLVAEKFLSAIPREYEYAKRLAEVTADAGAVLDDPSLTEWGRRLLQAAEEAVSGKTSSLVLSVLDQLAGVLPAGSTMKMALILERVRLHEREGEYHAAAAEINNAIAIEPQNPRLYLKRAAIREALKQDDLALSDYAHAAALRPDEGGPLVERASLLLRRKRWDEALADVTAALLREPANTAFLRKRANVFEQKGAKEEAEADYTKILELEPQDAWHWIDRAHFWQRVHDVDKALVDYQRALEIKSEDFIAGWIGDLLFSARRFDDAIEYFKRAIVLRDKPSGAAEGRKFKIGDLVRYIGPKDFEGRWGRVCEAMGDLPSALTQFTSAIDRSSDHDSAQYLVARARILEKLGRDADASKDFRGALVALNAAVAASGGRRDFLARRAELFEHTGDVEAALKDYSALLEEDSDEVNWWLARSNLYERLQRFDEAVGDFRQAYDREPLRDAIWEKHLARLLSYAGQFEEAFEVSRRALAIYPNDWEIAAQQAIMLARARGLDAARSTIATARTHCEDGLQGQYRGAAEYALATLAALEDRTDECLRMLSDSLADEPELRERAARDIAFSAIRSDPRFEAIMKEPVS